MANFVASGLFGDGAAAVVMVGRRAGGRARRPRARDRRHPQRALPGQRERDRLGHRRHRLPDRADRRGGRHDRRATSAIDVDGPARRHGLTAERTSTPGSRTRAARACSRRSSADSGCERAQLEPSWRLARRGRATSRRRRCCTCWPTSYEQRSPARTALLFALGPGVTERVRAAAVVGVIAVHGLHPARRRRADRRAVRLEAPRRVGVRARRGRERAAGTSRRWSPCTPGCWSGALAEVWLLDRPFIPWLGWPMFVIALACQAGRDLDHPLARQPVEHARHRRARHAARRAAVRTAGLAAAPELRRSSRSRASRSRSCTRRGSPRSSFTVLNAILLLGFRIPAEERALRRRVTAAP